MNEDKLAHFKEIDRSERYENGLRRMLVDMRIRQNREPWERVTPDEIVDISEE